jgi:hypothetical protein
MQVPLAFLFLHDVDYRVREAIFDCLSNCEMVRQKDSLTDRWKQHCIELAICYRLGFGTKCDEMTALAWLRKSTVNDAGFDAELGTVDSNTAAPYTPWTRWSENFHNDTAMSSYDLSYYLGRQSLGTVLQIHRRELGDWSPALGPQHWVVLEKQHTVMTFELARSNASQANETARDAYRTAMKERPQSWVTLTKARISLARVMLFYGLHDKAEGLARELLKSLSGSSNEMPTAIEAGHYQYVAEAKHLLTEDSLL